MKRDKLSTSPRDPSSRLRTMSGPWVLGLILAGTLLLWSSAFVAIPIGLETVEPFPLIIARLLVSSIFLFPVLVINWEKTIKPRLKQDFWPIFWMAAAGITLYLIFLTFGQRTVGAGQTSFIINLTPLAAGFFAALLLKETFKKRMIVGALVALLGVSFLVFREGSTFAFNFDAVLVFLAMIVSSLFYVIQRRLSAHYNAVTLTALAIVGGTVLFLPFSFGAVEGLADMSARSGLAIMYLGLMTIPPYIGWAYVLSKLTVGHASLYLYSIPVISTGLGWLILSEPVTINLVFSGALIFLGLLLGTGTLKIDPRSATRKLKRTRLQTRC